MTGEDIRRALLAFAQKWSVYRRSERSEAQTFLNELFACYGQDRSAVATFEEPQEGGFVDLMWPRVCLVEMKRPSEADRLEVHREQAFRYWRRAADAALRIPAPRFVVLCAFTKLEIWEPGAFPEQPRTTLDLIELPEQFETMLFLAGREPVFMGSQVGVTRGAVSIVAGLYQLLRERRAADADVLRDFVLQAVWCMFAEDLALLDAKLFTQLVDRLIDDPQRSSVDDLGALFRYLNTAQGGPAHGLYANVPYANGGLFASPALVHLELDELRALRAACAFDWHRVQPAIFGSLLEGGLGKEKQWAMGAHYTHEADIVKVVEPTIAQPWRERIENLSSHAQAVTAQNDLMRYVVLDPACGSGNFLYVAYRELRRLEQRLRERERELRRRAGLREQQSLSLFFPLSNIRGIELDGFAVRLARVTLWMGHKLAVDELQLDEATLPLTDLSHIRAGDALRVPWPRADAIIGNPPFHGDRRLRRVLGDAYVQWLQQQYKIGLKDYCCYWFRRAHDALEPGQRAGLVATNSVTQNRARPVTLDYIIATGGVITNAVSSQDWPGEAAVDVSIINWTKPEAEAPAVTPTLDGKSINEPIAGSLRPASIAVERCGLLAQNLGRAFFGCVPGNSKPGFLLTIDEAQQLLAGKPKQWRDVIRPYLIGDDLTDNPEQTPSRWVIDFGRRSLEQAEQFPEALALVRQRVKPARDKNPRKTYREHWWRFVEPLKEMRRAIAGMQRYIACPAQAKRIQFSFVDVKTCPSNLVIVFAFDDLYSLGILASFAHDHWLRAGWSTLEDRLRYTPSTVFTTFAWPSATPEQQTKIAESAGHMLTVRAQLARTEQRGLTDLYNLMDEGGYTTLANAHRTLDVAVADAYNWPTAHISDESATLRALMERNEGIVSGKFQYRGPGPANQLM